MVDQGKTIGIWTSGSSQTATAWGRSAEAAALTEQLGFSELWISGGVGGELAPEFGGALGATSSLIVASGILSIFHSDPAQVAETTRQLDEAHADRFILGLGVSHAPSVERIGQSYSKPYSAMVGYLDELDGIDLPGSGVPGRMLAALGDRMLRLSRDRSVGAHPYFVPVEHTAHAREVMGPDARLTPEQAVVVQTDPALAREIARRHMTPYLGLPNYTNNLRTLGWSEQDLAAPGSDALVDAIVAWGDPATIAARVQAHHDAGADCVVLQILTADADTTQRASLEALAAELL